MQPLRLYPRKCLVTNIVLMECLKSDDVCYDHFD